MDKKPEAANVKPLWDKISTALRSEVSPEVFDRWFKAAEPVEITAQHITLKVPNEIYRYWIEDNYIGSLRAATFLLPLRRRSSGRSSRCTRTAHCRCGQTQAASIGWQQGVKASISGVHSSGRPPQQSMTRNPAISRTRSRSAW